VNAAEPRFADGSAQSLSGARAQIGEIVGVGAELLGLA